MATDEPTNRIDLEVAAVDPTPTDDEMAAIVAALEATWPEPQPSSPPEPGMRWRFSGRWWSKPIPVRRDRP